jgi:hypothetical protein
MWTGLVRNTAEKLKKKSAIAAGNRDFIVSLLVITGSVSG